MLTPKPRLPIREMLLVGLLPSPLKKLVYRLKGYAIGRGVSFGLGAVICAEKVEIGDHVHIGFGSSIRGKTVRLGPHVQIGAMTLMDTPHVEIGEGTKINEQVFVGGLQFPDSRLVVGRNCQIMQMTFINPCRSITIGDDTGIGGDCLLFGHTSWLSKFEGYPVTFDTIEIGSSVSIAWRVFVLAGTKIADGAVVGANSLVKGSIPPRCVAVGFPAKVIAKAPYFPRVVSDEEKRRFLAEIMDEFERHLLANGFRLERRDSTLIVHARAPWWKPWQRPVFQLQVAAQPLSAGTISVHGPDATLVSLCAVGAALRQRLTGERTAWVDIENKERSDYGNDLAEEFIQYLKRYGVRLLRARL